MTVIGRREFLKGSLILSAAAGLLASRSSATATSVSRPNFLFLYADDLTYEAIGALGLTPVQTPNLDRLVRSGVIFTHAYNQGGWGPAICVASRTMLLTGLFLNNAAGLETGAFTGSLWPEHLAKAGYDTYFSGKWDVEADPGSAFKHANEERWVNDPPPEAYNRPIEGQPDTWTPWSRAEGDYWRTGRHDSELLADDGIAFLEQATGRTNPFFMYLAFNAPHDPRQAPKEYVERYPIDTIDVPENFMPEYPDKESIGCGKDLRDERLGPFPRTRHAIKVHRQEYYAIITHMDEQIGRILRALETSGQAENTYVIFTGDNGLALGHHGLMGKQNQYEHSVRVPLIMNGPGLPKGIRRSAPVYYQDIMPTTLELAGIPIPEHVQFKSLIPLIEGRRTKNYDGMFSAYKDLQRMVVKDGWKMIYYPKLNKILLFDLNEDPHEMQNLAGRKDHSNKLTEMWAALRLLQREVGDDLQTDEGA